VVKLSSNHHRNGSALIVVAQFRRFQRPLAIYSRIQVIAARENAILGLAPWTNSSSAGENRTVYLARTWHVPAIKIRPVAAILLLLADSPLFASREKNCWYRESWDALYWQYGSITRESSYFHSPMPGVPVPGMHDMHTN